MAGRPIKRAIRQAFADAKAHQRQLALRNGKEPMLPEYFASVGAPPVRNLPIPNEPAPPASLAIPAPTVKPGQVPLSQEDAERFARLRSKAIQRLLEFVEMEIDDYKPNAPRLRMKQIEIAQAVASLGGRVDPGSYRKKNDDEGVDEWLKTLTGGSA